MKKNKVIGMLLLILGIATIIGMVIDNAIYWITYNPIVTIFALVSGIILLKQK